MDTNFYDKDGNPISIEELEPLHADYNYRQIGRDHIGQILVSTVWLGVNHNFSRSGPPLIFETVVFNAPEESMLDDYCERYATEEEAKAGHARVVEMVRVLEEIGDNNEAPRQEGQ